MFVVFWELMKMRHECGAPVAAQLTSGMRGWEINGSFEFRRHYGSRLKGSFALANAAIRVLGSPAGALWSGANTWRGSPGNGLFRLRLRKRLNAKRKFHCEPYACSISLLFFRLPSPTPSCSTQEKCRNIFIRAWITQLLLLLPLCKNGYPKDET